MIELADVSTQTQKLYAEALKALRCGLDGPVESVKAETLAAAQLLCCFEVCKGLMSSWHVLILNHSTVIRKRQPRCFVAAYVWPCQDH